MSKIYGRYLQRYQNNLKIFTKLQFVKKITIINITFKNLQTIILAIIMIDIEIYK